MKGALFITGSLTVKGALHAYGDEWWSGTVVVLGDVRAARMLCLGPCAIGGALRLREGLYTAYYHDYTSSLIARTIEAPICLDHGDITGRVRGARKIRHVVRLPAWLSKQLPDYFEDDLRKVDLDEFDAAFFRAAVRAADSRTRR